MLQSTSIPSTVSLSKPKNRFDHLDNPKRRTISSLYVDEAGSRNSSVGGVWAEDYYGRDSLPCPPSPVARKNSEPACEEEIVSRKTRANTRGLTSLLPSFRTAKSKSPERKRSPSPEKAQREIEGEGDEREDVFMPTLTGDSPGVIKLEDRSRGGIAGWFNGSSAPVSLGISTADSDATSTAEMSPDSSPERPARRLQKRQTDMSVDSTSGMSATSTPQKSATISRATFSSFWSPKTSKPETTVQIPASLDQDELLFLSISDSLYPSGQDAFSASAYKNLQQNAEGLATKLHAAYKNRTLEYHKLQSETSVQSDELEEAETRAQLLRSQLDDLSSKFTEQEKLIGDLVLELAQEKQARKDESLAREKSIQIVKSQAKTHLTRESKHSSTSSLGLEDLGISYRYDTAGEAGLSGDSDTESLAADSVFSINSRQRSPSTSTLGTMPFPGSRNTAAHTSMSVDSTPEIQQASFARVVPNPGQGKYQPRPKPITRKSTYEKVLGGINGSEGDVKVKQESEDGCGNCRGGPASVAWDTVGVLRAENKGLKERVESLEGCVDEVAELCVWRRA